MSSILHPLHPLTAEEISTAKNIICKEINYTPNQLRFISITLAEPEKSIVNSYVKGQENIRKAFVVLLDNKDAKTYEILVSVTANLILETIYVPGVQPTMTADEQIECEQAVINSPLFKAALKRHGITNPEMVTVDIWTAGHYGAEEETTKRLARPLCFLKFDDTDNPYAHPIEGIRPVVDLNTMQVIRVEEHDVTPIPQQLGNYRADKIKTFRTDIKPLDIIQPDGPSFTVDNYEVNWQKWNFFIGFSSREGLVLNKISYNDEGNMRSILYRASLSEMVVPYGDPTETQYKKNAFDTGEYGMGQCANSLVLGCDCLGHIKYFDAVLNDSKGNPFTIKNAICMHEEDYGTLWKHTDRRTGVPEVRRSRRLVISSVSTVENYEYGFYWYLYQDGNIQFEIKLTGILSLGALAVGVKPKYGNLVAPELYAPNHQHFFNMRLDFDIDGERNSVYELNVMQEEDELNPYYNAFYAKSTLLSPELNAQRKLNLDTARTWKIVNPNVKNVLGEPVGYKLMPGDNCVAFANEKTSWYRRAGFVKNHLWVTPFNPTEMYGAGNYPNQHIGGDGLEKWTKANRDTQNTDIVVWYTMGHTHIPRMEDYPVMPTAYIGFLLKPNGFFKENPANDVPVSEKKQVTNANCCK